MVPLTSPQLRDLLCSSLLGRLDLPKLDQTCDMRGLYAGICPGFWFVFHVICGVSSARLEGCYESPAVARLRPAAGYGGIFTRWNRVFHQENWELVCHRKINVLPERCFHLDNYRHRPPDKASYEIKLHSHTARLSA